jgi:4-oxalocrotonate tautomerase
MPYLQLHTVKGMLSPEQKHKLMEKLSDLLVEIEGGGDPSFRKTVWIRIDEGEPENWRIGEITPDHAAIARFVDAREAARLEGSLK